MLYLEKSIRDLIVSKLSAYTSVAAPAALTIRSIKDSGFIKLYALIYSKYNTPISVSFTFHSYTYFITAELSEFTWSSLESIKLDQILKKSFDLSEIYTELSKYIKHEDLSYLKTLIKLMVLNKISTNINYKESAEQRSIRRVILYRLFHNKISNNLFSHIISKERI